MVVVVVLVPSLLTTGSHRIHGILDEGVEGRRGSSGGGSKHMNDYSSPPQAHTYITTMTTMMTTMTTTMKN